MTADFKGETIGAAKGTYMHRYLMRLLEQQKLTQDTKIVLIKPADAKALSRGCYANLNPMLTYCLTISTRNRCFYHWV
jgi:hypothetical protein